MLISATHIIGFLFGLLGIALIIVILVTIYFYRALKKQPRNRVYRQLRYQEDVPERQPPLWFSSPKSKQLERELLSLLRGNKQTLQRLLSYSQQHNRGKSIEWHLEKVKYDLERDRGAI